MRLNAKQIAEYTAANVLVESMEPSRLATGITWDSRTVKPGDVYLALPGERVDGHDFVESALCAGAIIALVMRPVAESVCLRAKEMGAAILEVSSTTAALTDLARAWRKHLKGRVIVLTGSTGKTTTKNLVRDVFSTTYKTVATHGNQNNELGVPKTLLEADPETDYVVIEMGMRGKGQLKSLCEFVKPDYALVTNTGESHIELLGSKDAIIQAKAEVVEALTPGVGVAVLNRALADSSHRIEEIARVQERDITVIGFDGSGLCRGDVQVYAKDISIDAEGKPSFTLCTPKGEQTCSLVLRGEHNVHNACAAAALGYVCGISLEKIIEGLEASLPEVGRQEINTNADGVLVINDAYNANPDSMRASLSTFASMDVSGKRIAVLGDMGELGDFAQACHEGIGKVIAELPIDYLLCIGELAGYIASAALESGFPRDRIETTLSKGEALGILEPLVEEGDAVLVKASHSMELERIVRGLLS